MFHRRLSPKTRLLLSVLILFSLAAFFKRFVALAQASSPAEVKSETLAVYSEMSTTSDVVKTLKKADHVSILFQITETGHAWCKIAELNQTNSLGYVLCSNLSRATNPQVSTPSSKASSVQLITGSASAQVSPSAVEAQQISGPQRTGSFITSFEHLNIKTIRRDPNISYDLDPGAESFYVYVPAGYSGHAPFGLLVFIDSDDRIEAPPNGWAGVLDARNLIFVAPQNAGNGQRRGRRLGLAVLAALEIMRHYQIDTNRVYVSGFSGGARMAGLLGFFQSDIFRGTIQNCGADFYQHVAQVNATTQLDTAGQPYGFFSARADEVSGAQRVRFVLITGSADFRRGNILDVFNGGFAKAGLQAKLFDVPGMSHDTADANTLNAALDFIEVR